MDRYILFRMIRRSGFGRLHEEGETKTVMKSLGDAQSAGNSKNVVPLS